MKKNLMVLLLALDLALVSCAAVAGLFCLQWKRALDAVPDSGYTQEVAADMAAQEQRIRQEIQDMHNYINQRNAESHVAYATAQRNWSEKYNALEDARALLEAITSGEKGG